VTVVGPLVRDRPPSVPEGTARLRISLTAGHTEEDVNRLLAALADSVRFATP
jgi:8-amino-7-oxononanoate synthase